MKIAFSRGELPCIGATTAVFSVIYAALMDPYPFPAADRIVVNAQGIASSGTVTRIVSFIGVGVLMLVIGWFAPVPPRDVSSSTM